MSSATDHVTPAKLPLRRRLLLAFLLVLICLGLLEGFARLFNAALKLGDPSDRETEPVLGWASIPDLRLEGEFPRYGHVRYSTHRHGFRHYGDPASPRLKILIVGDSVTEARKVSDDDTCSSRLGRHVDAEIFAFGAGGYGTLQEFLVLDRHLDEIRPDLVLLQVCDNDFVNNSHAMESRSRMNINHMVRPYLEGDQVVMRYPSQNWIYGSLLRHSLVIKSVVIHLTARAARVHGPSPAEQLGDESNPFFVDARDVTARILGRIKARCGQTPVVAFMACGRPDKPATRALRPLFARAGIPYVEEAAAAVAAAVDRGEVVNGMPDDSHWNANGSRIAAEALARALREQGLLPVPARP